MPTYEANESEEESLDQNADQEKMKPNLDDSVSQGSIEK